MGKCLIMLVRYEEDEEWFGLFTCGRALSEVLRCCVNVVVDVVMA